MVVAWSTVITGIKAATWTWFGMKTIELACKLGKTLTLESRKEHKSLPKFPSGRVEKFYKGASKKARSRFKRKLLERMEQVNKEGPNVSLISSFHDIQTNAGDLDDAKIINSIVMSNFSGCDNDCDCCIASPNDADVSLAATTDDCDASLASSYQESGKYSAVMKELQTLWEDCNPVLEGLSSTVEMEETLDGNPVKHNDVRMKDTEARMKDTDVSNERIILRVIHDIINAVSITTDDSMAEDNQTEQPEEVGESILVIDLDVDNQFNDEDTFNGSDDNGGEEVMTTLEEEENEVMVLCIKGNSTFLNHTLPLISIKKEVGDDEDYEVITIFDD